MIRKASIHEQQAIMNLIKKVVIDMESKNIHQWDDIYPNAKVINSDLNKDTLYIYEDKGVIKGITVLNEHQDKEYENLDWEFNSGKQLIVHRLCIDPESQGKGIAKAIMNYTELYGKEMGYEAIRLDTFIENEPACNLYERLGYKTVGTVKFRKGSFYCFEKKL